MKKLLKLLNIKNWVESFVGKMILNKGVKHAATFIIGFVTGDRAQNVLTQWGVSINADTLEKELMVLFGALAGIVLNWAQKAMDKDGDGKID